MVKVFSGLLNISKHVANHFSDLAAYLRLLFNM